MFFFLSTFASFRFVCFFSIWFRCAKMSIFSIQWIWWFLFRMKHARKRHVNSYKIEINIAMVLEAICVANVEGFQKFKIINSSTFKWYSLWNNSMHAVKDFSFILFFFYLPLRHMQLCCFFSKNWALKLQLYISFMQIFENYWKMQETKWKKKRTETKTILEF